MSSIVMRDAYTSAQETSTTANRRRFWLVGPGTVVAAVVANALFYYIGSVFVTYDPDFVVLQNVSGAVFFTVIPAIVAVLLYAGLLRSTANPARIFTIIAAIVFVLSLIPDFTYIPSQAGASNGQTAVLVVMHAIAASVIVGMLVGFTRQRAR